MEEGLELGFGGEVRESEGSGLEEVWRQTRKGIEGGGARGEEGPGEASHVGHRGVRGLVGQAWSLVVIGKRRVIGRAMQPL